MALQAHPALPSQHRWVLSLCVPLSCALKPRIVPYSEDGNKTARGDGGPPRTSDAPEFSSSPLLSALLGPRSFVTQQCGALHAYSTERSGKTHEVVFLMRNIFTGTSSGAAAAVKNEICRKPGRPPLSWRPSPHSREESGTGRRLHGAWPDVAEHSAWLFFTPRRARC